MKDKVRITTNPDPPMTIEDYFEVVDPIRGALVKQVDKHSTKIRNIIGAIVLGLILSMLVFRKKTPFILPFVGTGIFMMFLVTIMKYQLYVNLADSAISDQRASGG